MKLKKIHSENIPFELHLTTQTLDTKQLALFEACCLQYEVKPLLIELAQGEHSQQPMISKVFYKENFQSLKPSIHDLITKFTTSGFAIQRVKVEIPMQYAANIELETLENFTPYYEWHGKVLLNRLDDLIALCIKHGAHLSKNALKNDATSRFITIREYKNAETIANRVNDLIKDLEIEEWTITKQEFEYCIYDTNIALDAGWLPKN